MKITSSYLPFTLLAILLILTSCVSTQQKDILLTSTTAPITTQVNSTPESQQPPTQLPKKTCEEQATELIPKTLNLTIASSNNPNVSGWDLNSSAKWNDGEPIMFKGDIQFQKGRYEGQNPNYWYTINIQNEKLFGIGGLKYLKTLASEAGTTIGKNLFIIKPVLKPIQIIDPPYPYAPYAGTFEVIDPGFVNCTGFD